MNVNNISPEVPSRLYRLCSRRPVPRSSCQNPSGFDRARRIGEFHQGDLMARRPEKSRLLGNDGILSTSLAVSGMDLQDPQRVLCRLLSTISFSPASPKMSIIEPSLTVISLRSGDRLYT